MDVTLYTFEDSEGGEDTYSTFRASEAEDYAKKYHMRIIANEYEWSDSEVVADYTTTA